MRQMKFSAILLNYNDCELLPRALKAVLSQNIMDMEILIIDDGSTDNSWDILSELQKLDPRIRLIKQEVNQGINQTMMNGWSWAQGEFLYLGSANDYIFPGFFSEAICALQNHPEAGFFCATALLNKNEKISTSDLGWGDQARYFSPKDLMLLTTTQIRSFHGQSVVLRKAALPPKEFLFTNLKGNFDLFLFFVIAFQQGFFYSPTAYSCITLSDSSFSAQGKALWSKAEKVKALLKNLELPYYAPIKKAWIHSGLLSFLGFTLPYLIIRKAFWRYASWKLVKNLSVLSYTKLQRLFR